MSKEIREQIDMVMNWKQTSYPLEDRGRWYGDSDYKTRGGVLVKMTPDEFLNKAKPLEMDEYTREQVDNLKQLIKSGRKLDP